MKSVSSKEVKIGIAAIIALFVLYFGISFLKGVNIFKPTNSYNIEFKDVTDLTVSSPVVISGYQVGLVNEMTILDNNNILVSVNLKKGIKIPHDSQLKIDAGMLGGARVMLLPGTSTTYYTVDDTIKGARGSGMLDAVSAALPQVTNLLPKVDSILISLQAVVSHQALTSSLENVDQITSNLKVTTSELNRMMLAVNKNVPAITQNMNAVSQDLADLSAQTKAMDIESLYKSIDTSLKNIETLSNQINSKDNSIGLLLNDRQLYDSITSTLNNASLLLKDVKENPSRYINVKVF